MLKRIIPATLTLGLVACLAAPMPALAIPPTEVPSVTRSNSWVIDTADILSRSTEIDLNTQIDALKENTEVEIAIVTVDSYEGLENYEYAIQMVEHWGGLGNTDADSGLIFLVSVGDRDSYIAVGYGMEPYITDATAANMTRLAIPYFKEANFDEGVTVVASAMIDGAQNTDFSAYAPEEFDINDIAWAFYIWTLLCIVLTIGTITKNPWNWYNFWYTVFEILVAMGEGSSSGSSGGGRSGGRGRSGGDGSFGGGGGGSKW